MAIDPRRMELTGRPIMPELDMRGPEDDDEDIQEVIDDMLGQSKAQLEHISLVNAANPSIGIGDPQRMHGGGKNGMYPYKAWLMERRRFLDTLKLFECPPSTDEKEWCDVARDLFEMGRDAEGQAMLDEHAPLRHDRTCPACGRQPGRPCRESYIGNHNMTMTRDLPVPHESRLVPAPTVEIAGKIPKVEQGPQYPDSGPLFERFERVTRS